MIPLLYGVLCVNSFACKAAGQWLCCMMPARRQRSVSSTASYTVVVVVFVVFFWRQMADVDFWPMWPVDDSVQDCRKRTRLNTTAILATPWDAYMHAKPAQAINPCTLQQQANAGSKRRWCIHSATKPFHTKPGTRGAPISNRWFPTPADQDE